MSGWLNDESTYNHIATPVSAGVGVVPTYSTSIKKFGSSSAKFARTSDVAGGYLSIPDSSAFTLGRTSSINFWIYPLTAGVHMGVFGNWLNGDVDYGWKWYIHEDDLRIRSQWSTTLTAHSVSFINNTGLYLLPLNAWTHVAFSRDDSKNRWRLWINGVFAYQKDSTPGTGSHRGDVRNSSNVFRIGCQDDLAGSYTAKYFLDAYIDALHIENGVSNWEGDDGNVGTKYFSPENYVSGPTPTAYTTLLMNFDETLYEVAGTLSHDSRIIVVDEATRTVEYDAVESAGEYSVTVNDTNEKSVFAVKESDGDVLGYGRVIPAIQ